MWLGLATYKADPVTGTSMQEALGQIYKGLAKKRVGKVDPFPLRKMGIHRGAVNQ